MIYFRILQAQEEQRTERAREALHSESVLQIRMPDMPIIDESRRRMGSRFSPFTVVPNRLRKDSRSFLTTIKSLSTLQPPLWISEIWKKVRIVSRVAVQNGHFQRAMTIIIVVNTICLALDYHDQNLFESSICRRRCEMDPNIPSAALQHCVGPIFNRSWTFDGQGGGKRQNQSLFCFLENDANIFFPQTSAYYPGYNCSMYTDIDNCTAVPSCGWINNACKLGLYTVTTFAANTTGSAPVDSIEFRDICGGINEVFISLYRFRSIC